MRNSILSALLFFPTIAGAHAMLDHADPAVGSTVAKTPSQITLTFDEPVNASACSVEVTDASGRRVDGNDVHADAKDTSALVVSLKGGTGKLKVVWKATSTGDGHHTHGDYTFTVGG